MGTAEDFLEHFGKKGMKWGVRNDAGHQGEKATLKKINKLDTKFDKHANSLGSAIAIHNRAADLTNRLDVDRINNKPEYKNADFSKPSDLRSKYYKEHQDAFISRLEQAANEQHNASGTKQYTVMVTDNGDWKISSRNIAHAESPDVTVQVTYDATGHIRKLTPFDPEMTHAIESAENFLEQSGVKGMKWGVRKERNPVEVSTSTSPGRKVKTTGGQNQPAHPDAVAAARLRQQAKKSTTDSLSNKDLQAAVTRMNLEQQYARLSAKPPNKGLAFLKSFATDKKYKEQRELVVSNLKDPAGIDKAIKNVKL